MSGKIAMVCLYSKLTITYKNYMTAAGFQRPWMSPIFNGRRLRYSDNVETKQSTATIGDPFQ